MYKIVASKHSTIDERDKRTSALNKITSNVFMIAYYIMQNYPPQWSKDYPQLAIEEQYWLDPKRSELDKEFRQNKDDSDWVKSVIDNFARWINNCLRKQFPKQKDEIGDEEHNQWYKHITLAIKASQRAGKSIFEKAYL